MTYALNPFNESKFTIGVEDMLKLLNMSKSGISLYKHILSDVESYIAPDGIAYLDQKLLADRMGITTKSVYNGLDSMLYNGALSRTGRPKEYFYNPKYFPNEFISNR